MEISVSNIATIGYSLAGIEFLLLVVLLATIWKGRLQGGILALTAVAAAFWAFVLAWRASGGQLGVLPNFLLEFGHDAAWLLFLTTVLARATSGQHLGLFRQVGMGLVSMLILTGIGLEIVAQLRQESTNIASLLSAGSVLTALFALVAAEQVYRNAREVQSRGLKYLCLGIGGIFAFDIYLYSDAMFAGKVDETLWAARGAVVAMCVPLLGVAAHRSTNWSPGIFVSRQVVFYAVLAIGAGLYIALLIGAGFYLRFTDRNLGPVVQLIAVSAGIVVLFLLLASEKLRARLKVFISKHFFENRYDYRQEWLRLTETLTSASEALPLKKRAIRAMAQIVKAPNGLLWLAKNESADYVCVAGWNRAPSERVINRNSSLPRFLEDTGWVVEMREFRLDSDRYSALGLDGSSLEDEGPEFVIPLQHDHQLLGFIYLSAPETAIALNYEDRDLLKTAGQQIASYLAQEIATEQLSEHRQFEAFNRLTAYLMHDLKNVVAQQSLVVENARKHKSNPKFIEDVIGTVENSVSRMRRVIDHLQGGGGDQPVQNVELGKLIMQAVSPLADRHPAPRALIGDEQFWVRADKDRLLSAVQHAISNAQDAVSGGDGSITVAVSATETQCSVAVADNGRGMDDAFVRERLFKPFDSTKGTSGMGIGAHQLRETVRQLGGEVDVRSRPGEGTTITLTLERVPAQKV